MSYYKSTTVTFCNDGYLVCLHRLFYSQTAIFAAAYKFTGKNIVKIFPMDERSIGVLFKPKNGRTLTEVENDAQIFVNEVLDQQIRLNLEREFGHIRDVIVEYAFSPVKKKFLKTARGWFTILPFSYKVLESKEVLLVNCVGEYIVISIQEFNALLTNPFAIHSDTFKLLKCKNFFTDYDLELAIEMLATKLRTRKAFLRNFTSLHMVVLTAHCNGRCDYCHASSSDVAKGPLSQNMRPDVADAVVDMIFMSPSQYIKIEFQGGEPLINWEVLVRIVHRAKKINKTANKKLEFVVCTNMTLLDYDKVKFLMKEGIQISTSLDGPKELHDLHRKMRDGSSSYDKFIENLSIVCRVMEAESVSPLLTITRDHLKRLPEVIDEYIRLGFKGIFLRSLNPYGFAREDLAALGYSMEEFIEAYKEGFDYILQKNRNGVHFVEYFATLILSRILTPFSTGFVDLQFPAGAGISGVIYDYDGCVYPSDEARMLARTGDKKFLLGNVIDNSYEEIFEGNKLKSIISMSCAEVMPGCTSCVYQAYCGSDPVRNYVESGDVMGFRPSSDFCKKNMGIIDFLFKYILENNEQVMDIFWSWITGRSLEDVRL